MGINEGDVVLYTCDIGYAIAGQSGNTDTATCGSGGNWNNIPTCVGKICEWKHCQHNNCYFE